MTHVFEDRVEVGPAHLRSRCCLPRATNAIVLALPRGGVPVGFEVAQALGLPLDVLAVRKLGLPGQPELAMGRDRERWRLASNEDVLRFADGRRGDPRTGAASGAGGAGAAREADRAPRPPLQMTGCTAILVDDGLATGATMEVAVRALRGLRATRIVVAVPVASQQARDRIAAVADEGRASRSADVLQCGRPAEPRLQPDLDAEVGELLAQTSCAWGSTRPVRSRKRHEPIPGDSARGVLPRTVSANGPGVSTPKLQQDLLLRSNGATARGATQMSELGPQKSCASTT